MRMLHAAVMTGIVLLGPAVSAEAAQAVKQENIKFAIVEVSTVTSKITDIDRQARTVTLTDEEGKFKTVTMPDYVTNFGELRKGDTVTMEVNQDVSVEVQPGPGHTQNIGSESQTSALPGQKPGGMLSVEGRLKTKVEAIDYDKRTITYKNRRGIMTTYTFNKDAKRFDEVRRGDMLVIDYKGTVAISVK